jgi:hypothetical protein
MRLLFIRTSENHPERRSNECWTDAPFHQDYVVPANFLLRKSDLFQ